MNLNNQVKVQPCTSIKQGMAEFHTHPLASHEIVLDPVPAGFVSDLRLDGDRTNQLFVVRGSLVVVVLEAQGYQYLALSESCPAIVNLPPGVGYGIINLSDEPSWLINRVLQHGAVATSHCETLKPVMPYDLTAAQAALEQLNVIEPLSA